MRILQTMFVTLASYIGSTLLFVEAAQSYTP